MKLKLNTSMKNYSKNILFFLVAFVLIASVILSRFLGDLDEIWNYSFAKNMADGLIPYRDFNMVITPLLPLICSLFFKILGNELIVMRLLAIGLITFIFFMSYLILKKLKLNPYYNVISLFLLFLILSEYICIDYNFMVLAINLLIIYLELIYMEKVKNYFEYPFLFYFFIGLLSSSCILLKQTTGFFITCITIIYPILLIKNKYEIKKYIKITFYKIIGIIIPLILLFIYLLVNHALHDFIDYTILGIKTFTNFIPYYNLINSKKIYIKFLSIFMPIFILLSFIYIWKKKKQKLLPFYCYSIGALIVIFPISDNIHFLVGIFPFTLLLIYFSFYFVQLLVKKIKNRKIKILIMHIINSIIFLIILSYFITSFIVVINYFTMPEIKNNKNHYQMIPISKDLLNKMNIINNYILSENKNVYILDSDASIYMVNLDLYHKNFDLFNIGNHGSKGSDGLIEDIKHFEPGVKLLIKNDKRPKNWQTPMEVIQYVKNNLPKIGEINIFDIYEIQ